MNDLKTILTELIEEIVSRSMQAQIEAQGTYKIRDGGIALRKAQWLDTLLQELEAWGVEQRTEARVKLAQEIYNLDIEGDDWRPLVQATIQSSIKEKGQE